MPEAETAPKPTFATCFSATAGSQVMEAPRWSSALAAVMPRFGGTPRSAMISTLAPAPAAISPAATSSGGTAS